MQEQDQQLTTIVTSTPLDVLIYAWLDAKKRRSGSVKTHKAYEDTLKQFRSMLRQTGLDLDYQDDASLVQIALAAQGFSRMSARPGHEVKPATINQRLAILSSFYEHGIKQCMFADNPIARVDRAKVQDYGSAQPLAAEMLDQRMSAIERDTLQGKRDYALLAVLLTTGRRLAEVAALTIGNLETASDGRLKVTFERVKGGETLHDTLSYPTTHAVLDWLRAFYGPELAGARPGAPVFVVLINGQRDGHAWHIGDKLGEQSVADILKKRLGVSKVHATRHTWAHTAEALGVPISEIQARLNHKSLATTGRYLQQLKSGENKHADKISAHLGIR